MERQSRRNSVCFAYRVGHVNDYECQGPVRADPLSAALTSCMMQGYLGYQDPPQSRCTSAHHRFQSRSSCLDFVPANIRPLRFSGHATMYLESGPSSINISRVRAMSRNVGALWKGGLPIVMLGLSPRCLGDHRSALSYWFQEIASCCSRTANFA